MSTALNAILWVVFIFGLAWIVTIPCHPKMPYDPGWGSKSAVVFDCVVLAMCVIVLLVKSFQVLYLGGGI